MGFALAFQVTVRRAGLPNASTVPAMPSAHRTSWACRRGPSPPRTLSHVVYFVPDAAKAEAFYQRLGFVCTDRFTGVGPSCVRPGRWITTRCS
jgi:hypothetical protein